MQYTRNWAFCPKNKYVQEKSIKCNYDYHEYMMMNIFLTFYFLCIKKGTKGLCGHALIVSNKYSLFCFLTLSWRGSLSYSNQSIDLLCKSMDRFLYDRDLRHESIKCLLQFVVQWFGAERLMYIFFKNT